MFDADRVPELHLPTFTGASGAGETGSSGSPGVVDPGTAHSRKTAGEEVGKDPRKFMLGVNYPVVPARIVKRILNCEFGDMAELSNDSRRGGLVRGMMPRLTPGGSCDLSQTCWPGPGCLVCMRGSY